MCSTSFLYSKSRKTKMNTEGKPAKAMKRKKKTRRLKKRKHQDVDNREFAVVPVKRTKGKTAAPENTTQFIMDDREKVEPFLLSSPSLSPNSSTCDCSLSPIRGSPLSEADFPSLTELSGGFDELYFEKDFNDVYDSIHTETLLALSKQELINRYLELEKKEEILQRQVRNPNGDCTMGPIGCFLRACASTKTSTTTESTDQAPNNEETAPHGAKGGKTAEDFISQLHDLQRTNRQLLEENERLRGCTQEG